MTVTLFADTNYKGKCQSFAKNKACLKDTKVGNNPSSIKITGDEAVLLFKKQDWKGGVLYVKGPKNVCDLGKRDEGGKSGFKNGVTSMRRTPFTLDLNITVVRTSKNRYPGAWTSTSDAETAVTEIVDLVNQFYADCAALLKLKIAKCTIRESDAKFVINRGAAKYPAKWKKDGQIDVVFVHDFERIGVTGRSKPPGFGQALTVTAMVDYEGGGKGERDNEEMARTLEHEIGHYLGVHHPSANGNRKNIMFSGGGPDKIGNRVISADQIEQIHTALSKNIFRKGNR